MNFNNQEPLVYKISEWDKYQWSEFLESNEENQTIIDVGVEKVPEFDTFSSEVFHRLYSQNPQRIERTRPEAEWAVKAHNEISTSAEFEALQIEIKLQSQGNSFKKRLLSGMGAMKFSEIISQSLPNSNVKEKPQELRKKAKSLVNSIKKLQEKEQLNQKEQNLLNALTSELTKVNKEGKKEVAKSQGFAEKVDETMSSNIKKASQSAQQNVQDLGETLNSFGWGSESGNPSFKGNLAEKLKVAKDLANNKKLIKIAKIAGRLKLLAAKKQRQKTKQVKREMTSVETGNDLNRVLPSELIKLIIPELQPLFFKDYTEKSLLQYSMGGKETLGKGPLVICLDSSGSMDGEREEWSKGVAIALLHLANSQKRDCRIVHFDNEVKRTDDFPRGEIDSLKLKECMEYFSGGGTGWEPPLNSAISLIESQEKYTKADIVFITDGQCDVEDDWLEIFLKKKQDLKINIFGVLIGNQSEERLNEFCDLAIALTSLNDDNQIEQFFDI